MSKPSIETALVPGQARANGSREHVHGLPDIGARYSQLLPSRSALRFFLLIAIVGGSAVAGVARLGSQGLATPSALRAAVQQFGPWGPALFVAILACRPFLFLPSAPVMMAGGLAFGASWGTALTTLGFTLAALTTYLLARLLGHDYVREKLGPRLDLLAAGGMGPGIIFVLNMLPVTPLSIPNYAAGLTAMPVVAFLTATAVGLLPRVLAWSTVGSILVEFDTRVLLAATTLLLALLATPLLFPSIRHRLQRKYGDTRPIFEK